MLTSPMHIALACATVRPLPGAQTARVMMLHFLRQIAQMGHVLILAREVVILH